MSGRKSQAVDIVGKEFGRWTVLARAGSTAMKRATWLCRCQCGVERVVEGMNLRHGLSRSCGCLRSEPYAKTHGKTGTPAYLAWKRMKVRCDNPKMQNYQYYGGRGITYTPSWASFTNFYADMGDPPDGLSLDRIDNAKGYFKENCRWTDQATQRHNRTDKVTWVDIHGERLVLTNAVKKYGKVSLAAVLMRLGKGWDVLAAILTPAKMRDARDQ